MDTQFPSIEEVLYILPYDRSNASFNGLEAARIVRVMLVNGYTWQWALAIAVLSSLSFSLWRLWTFTVRPWIHPEEAREVPYWVPCKIQTSRAVQKLIRLQDLGIVCSGPISWATNKSELKVHGIRSFNGILPKFSWSDYRFKVSIAHPIPSLDTLTWD